ncbi:hypothetical protein F5884DRAFT_666405 [Xylogone sp. PMI_703]|nr:hypothetical protein F5884DRAFT_666405 [Xylogone sp. PMI_703]
MLLSQSQSLINPHHTLEYFHLIMKLSSILLLSLAESFLVGATNTCHADNCARAVSGTQQGYGHLYTASSDCSSFVGTSTVTSCVTSTVAWTIVTVTPSLLKRYGPSSSSIPLYASACTDSEAYSSACSCLGITQHTVTSTDAVIWTNSSSHASHTTYTLPPAYTFSIPIVTTASTTFISSGSGIWNTSTSSTTPLYPNSSWTTVPFETCGIAETCFCFTTADGGGSCGQNAICEDLADCQSNSDCDEDSICAVNSCCERNVCLPGGCDNPAAKLMRMAGST